MGGGMGGYGGPGGPGGRDEGRDGKPSRDELEMMLRMVSEDAICTKDDLQALFDGGEDPAAMMMNVEPDCLQCVMEVGGGRRLQIRRLDGHEMDPVMVECFGLPKSVEDGSDGQLEMMMKMIGEDAECTEGDMKTIMMMAQSECTE